MLVHNESSPHPRDILRNLYFLLLVEKFWYVMGAVYYVFAHSDLLSRFVATFGGKENSNHLVSDLKRGCAFVQFAVIMARPVIRAASALFAAHVFHV